MSKPRTKITILGGGPSALTTAFHLTSDERLRERYDITVYQMGWRLGGKGRSGRGEHGRIEEHGLHILFGFYQNFFTMMRACYAELGRPPSHPFAAWRDAFQPADFGVVEHWFQGQWTHLPVEFPGNWGVPGEGEASNSSWDYLFMLVQDVVQVVFGSESTRMMRDRVFPRGDRWKSAPDRVPEGMGRADKGVRMAIRLLKIAFGLARRQSTWLKNNMPRLRNQLIDARSQIWDLLGQRARRNVHAARFWTGFDFLATVAIGAIEDRLFDAGRLHAIDEDDLRAWLRKHGAHEETLASMHVRMIYDAAFSFEGGNMGSPRVAAGAALRAITRMALTYKGSGFYKMCSGMGDVVFAPLYLLLKRRGVRFEFFHKVESLHLSPNKDAVESIRITRQAELADPEQEYEPLIDVGGLECWPALPRYEQLRDAEHLHGIDLESYYTPWQGVGTRTLYARRDFDQVVLATPVGCLPFICQEILRHSPRWRAMVENVKAVQTTSLQLWFERDLRELGWKMPAPLLSLYTEPLSTWADMTQVLASEPWPHEYKPRSVQYFTGPQLTADPPPLSDFDFPTRENAKAREIATTFVSRDLTHLLPMAVDPLRPPAFDWRLLSGPQHLQGAEKMYAQYVRSNCDPSDRCTVALPGATKHRMKAGETGFMNLFVTGDWIDNGLYVACMEGAIQAGVLTARAVSGIPFQLIGEEVGALLSHKPSVSNAPPQNEKPLDELRSDLIEERESPDPVRTMSVS